MISISINNVENTITNHNQEIVTLIKNKKNRLQKLLEEPTKKDYASLSQEEIGKKEKKFKEQSNSYKIVTKTGNAQYLNYLISNLERIIYAKPNELSILESEFEEIMPKQNIEKRFKDILIKAMDYNGWRNTFYPKYFHELGIKSCVYCNSQLAIVSNKTSNHFEIDHYKAKDKLPCFSTSFYNLYPVCGSCNRKKLNNDILFELYTNEKNISDFSFEIEITSLSKYLISGENSDLKILFNEKNSYESKFNSIFKIEGIYNTQKDIAEELILKSKIYTETYKNTLVKSFDKLYQKGSIGKRMIIGNYLEDSEIHNRPLAKFTQDIAKQLGLIP